MPTPMTVPTRVLSSSFNSNCASVNAICEAARDRWMKRSIFFCSFLGTKSSGLNPLISPAMRQSYAAGSKWLMVPTPDRPAVRPAQLEATSRPSGEIKLMPVTTTRRSGPRGRTKMFGPALTDVPSV